MCPGLFPGLVLTHYDPASPLTMAAVPMHPHREWALSFCSRTQTAQKNNGFCFPALTSSEQDYAQIKKEALVLVFSVK